MKVKLCNRTMEKWRRVGCDGEYDQRTFRYLHKNGLMWHRIIHLKQIKRFSSQSHYNQAVLDKVFVSDEVVSYCFVHFHPLCNITYCPDLSVWNLLNKHSGDS